MQSTLWTWHVQMTLHLNAIPKGCQETKKSKEKGSEPNLVDESCYVVDFSVDGEEEAILGSVLRQVSEGVRLGGHYEDVEYVKCVNGDGGG